MKFVAVFHNVAQRTLCQIPVVAANLDEAKLCAEWMLRTYFPGFQLSLIEMLRVPEDIDAPK